MQGHNECLHLIRKVREVAAGEEVAYVARSRIGRLVLALTKLVGKITKIDVGDRPSRIAALEEPSLDVRKLITHCNVLYDTSRILAQPSEPLDERWKKGWSRLLHSLDEIEEHLLANLPNGSNR